MQVAARATGMHRTRPVWIRELKLYRGLDERVTVGADFHEQAPHARSRFRSLAAPDRFAEYSVRDASRALATEPSLLATDDHTLVVVREFRRVPLDASSLALMLFVAQPGR